MLVYEREKFSRLFFHFVFIVTCFVNFFLSLSLSLPPSLSSLLGKKKYIYI